MLPQLKPMAGGSEIVKIESRNQINPSLGDIEAPYKMLSEADIKYVNIEHDSEQERGSYSNSNEENKEPANQVRNNG